MIYSNHQEEVRTSPFPLLILDSPHFNIGQPIEAARPFPKQGKIRGKGV